MLRVLSATCRGDNRPMAVTVENWHAYILKLSHRHKYNKNAIIILSKVQLTVLFNCQKIYCNCNILVLTKQPSKTWSQLSNMIGKWSKQPLVGHQTESPTFSSIVLGTLCHQGAHQTNTTRREGKELTTVYQPIHESVWLEFDLLNIID